MKTCSKCSEEKAEDEFRVDQSRKDNLNIYCTKCLKLQHNARYEERYKIKSVARSRKRHLERKVLKEEYLSDKSCLHCGEEENCALDFHHIDETDKDFTISGGHQRSWDVILNEINKCVILCASCHRKFHYGSLSHLKFGE